MTTPNIVNSSMIYGDTDPLVVSTTITTITTNPASSNTVYKINSLVVCNINANAAITTTVDVTLNRSATDYHIAKNITVPVTASLIVISKDMGIYLLEGDSIKVAASGNNELEALCSYETIRDV